MAIAVLTFNTLWDVATTNLKFRVKTAKSVKNCVAKQLALVGLLQHYKI